MARRTTQERLSLKCQEMVRPAVKLTAAFWDLNNSSPIFLLRGSHIAGLQRPAGSRKDSRIQPNRHGPAIARTLPQQVPTACGTRYGECRTERLLYQNLPGLWKPRILITTRLFGRISGHGSPVETACSWPFHGSRPVRTDSELNPSSGPGHCAIRPVTGQPQVLPVLHPRCHNTRPSLAPSCATNRTLDSGTPARIISPSGRRPARGKQTCFRPSCKRVHHTHHPIPRRNSTLAAGPRSVLLRAGAPLPL